MIPVLNSERLTLRGFTWADFPAFAEMWANPALAPFIPFAPVAKEQSWARFNGNCYAWVRRGFGNWAVVDPTGQFLGVTGFFRNVTAGMGAEYNASIQSGWVFAKAARGRGLASEAVALTHRWIDQQPFGGVTVCGMDPGHAASIRVAEKIGYEVLDLVEDEWGATQTMRRVLHPRQDVA